MKILALLAALLSGCAVQSRLVDTPYGKVLELEGVDCPDTSSRYGCAIRTDWAIFYADGQTLDHERAHTTGMKHGQWEIFNGRNCARVIAPGATGLKAGSWLCRDADGVYRNGT